MTDIPARLAAVRSRIDDAARAAGRDPSGIRLVAVSKKVPVDAIRVAYDAGHRDFGENYLQEAVRKIEELAPVMPAARWHFVGRLQSNKAAAAVAGFSLLHGIDSPSTVAALSRAATRAGTTIDVLLQIRLGSRTDSATAGIARGGVEAEAAAAFLEDASSKPAVRFVGLMGVADPDLPARPQFADLRSLSSRLAALRLASAPLGELSIGMTDDFEDAVAEGATIVRIGTAIFGERLLSQA